MTHKPLDSLILDNSNLLDCYYQTGYLTRYLDDLQGYKPYRDDIYLLKGIRSRSLLSSKGYQALITHPSNSLLHLSFLYLLLYLDKLDYSSNYIIEYLRINNNKYNNMFRTISEYKLRSILRPSKPWIGLRHKGVPRF